MSILDGTFTGFVIGLVMATPSVIAEHLRLSRELPLLMDVKTIRGRNLTPHQELFWSVAVHLAMSSLFGGIAPFLVSIGVLSPLYIFGEMAAYAIGFFIVMGAVVFPAVGFGFFGSREGEYVWLELLLTNLLYGFLFWAAANLFFV